MDKKAWLIVSCCLAILISSYSIVQYFFMDAHQAGFVKLKLMLNSTLSLLWYLMLYTHIICGVLALIIGPFTLFSKFREKNIKLHRTMGRIYMIGILFGGISGLYLAFHATGGVLSQLGFGLLSIFWLITASQALANIKQKKIDTHEKWMIRNYSLTFAAVTLRIWLALFTGLFGFHHFEISYAIIAWLCWVPNLIVAEWLIKRKHKKRESKLLFGT